jgi:hypothetical protein
VTVFGIDPLLLISSHPIIDEKRNTFLSCILLRKCSFSQKEAEQYGVKKSTLGDHV